MKRIHVLSIAIAGLIFLASCSSSKEPVGVWVNTEKIQGKSFSNIFIVVMTADIEARSVIENDLAAAAVAKGYKAVKSIDVLPPSLNDPKLPSKEDVINKVIENNCDAIFVAALLKKEDSLHYTPSKTKYAPNTHVASYGNFYGYYSNYSSALSTNAYYTVEKKYFIQSNLYDVATKEIMWSVQSKIFDPASLKDFSRIYTGSLILKLEKSTILQKRQK